MKQRLTGSATFAGALVIGAAVGIGGASMALWSDAADVTGTIESGYEYFAVGAPGEVKDAIEGEVAFTIDGTEAAKALIDDGKFATPIQVDSLSQGNKGLRYELQEPDWGEHILGQATIEVFWVDSPEVCEPGARPGTPPEHVDEHTSTPVDATYSDDTDVTTEFWCVHATLTGLPDEGEYTNVGTVTAEDPSGTEVSDSDDWSATVTTGMDPGEEPNHTIEFTYTTFRPGETP